jgi:hypothetical protein
MSKKKESKDTTPKISITERVEMLSRQLSALNALCDENSERGNKCFGDVEKRLDKIESSPYIPKCIICKDLGNYKNTHACHSVEDIKKWCSLSNKPKVGEIWKSHEGNFYLIKEEADSVHYYNGFVPCFKAYELKYNVRLFKHDEIISDFTVIGQHRLIEKIC